MNTYFSTVSSTVLPSKSEETTMKMTKKIVVSLLAMAMAFGATTASANEGFLEGRVSTLQTNDNGYAAAAGANSTGGVGLAVGYELDVIEPGALRVMGLWDVDGISTTRFDGDLGVDWGRNRLMVGADYGYDILPWLRPLARVTMGYSHQSLRLATDGVTYRAGDHGLSGILAGGVEVSMGRSDTGTDAMSRLSLGLNLLAGYTWQTRANFDDMTSLEAPDEPDEDDPWIRSTYDAGSMRVSGFTWNFGVMLRYRL